METEEAPVGREVEGGKMELLHWPIWQIWSGNATRIGGWMSEGKPTSHTLLLAAKRPETSAYSASDLVFSALHLLLLTAVLLLFFF